MKILTIYTPPLRYRSLPKMENQTFCKKGLIKVIRKSDFLGIPSINQAPYGETLLEESVISAQTKFGFPMNPLVTFQIKNNLVYKLYKHSDRIVERKLALNLRKGCSIQTTNRSNIIQNLKLLLREGTPYRIYRLDISKFYESIPHNIIFDKIHTNHALSPKTKSLIKHLLVMHQNNGGSGVPRGLPISSCISELIMQDFDLRMNNDKNIFFYSRYVDDIILISTGDEDQKIFLKYIGNSLPNGLILNSLKKEISHKILPLVTVKDTNPQKIIYSFEYLGYKFNVSDPYKKIKSDFRVIDIDIATKKANKYKQRISRAFYDFTKTKDWNLLKDRIKFLTGNFRVFNPHINKTKLAGIFYNYPEIQNNVKNLKDLDHYFRRIVLSKHGRLAILLNSLLTSKMKRELLLNSFIKGHTDKKFIHFSQSRIGEIKKCWKY